MVLAKRHGTLDLITDVVTHNSPLLPGTDAPLLTSYTGIRRLDAQLAILVTFFAPVVDRSHSNLTLSGGFGLGQFGAAWALLMLESLRFGNKAKVVSLYGTSPESECSSRLTFDSIVIFGLILQNFTFAVTIPVYLLIHLLTSPSASLFPGKHTNTVLIVSPIDLKLLPWSIVLGYVVPSLLMALPPTIVSSTVHQQFIALWQPFPLWTVVVQWSGKFVYNLFATKTSQSDSSQAKSYLKGVGSVYGFVLGLCIVTHLPVLAITLLPPSAFPESSVILTRLSQSDFFGVYVPYPPVLGLRFSDLAEGVQNFLVWDLYVGMTAVLLWATLLYRNATGGISNKSSWPKVVWKLLTWTLVSGPMGAATILLWERDANVGHKVKQGI